MLYLSKSKKIRAEKYGSIRINRCNKYSRILHLLADRNNRSSGFYYCHHFNSMCVHLHHIPRRINVDNLADLYIGAKAAQGTGLRPINFLRFPQSYSILHQRRKGFSKPLHSLLSDLPYWHRLKRMLPYLP